MRWFVEPKTVRLDLPDGQWIEVKRELSQGEEDDVIEASKRQDEQGHVITNVGKWSRARALAFITGWSLPEPLNPAALCAMTTEGFAAIRKAINAHEASVNAEKNAPATPSE